MVEGDAVHRLGTLARAGVVRSLLRRLMLSTVLVLGAASAQSAPIPGTSLSVSNWHLGAYSNDQTGRFSHCGMSAAYKSGITMLFSLSSSNIWRIGWAHPAWTLTKGQRLDVSLFIDGAGPQVVTAIAVTQNAAFAELPSNANLLDQFKQGYQLRVVAHGTTYVFNLDGTNAALTALGECVARQAPAGTPSAVPPPIVGGAPPPPIVGGAPASTSPPGPRPSDLDDLKIDRLGKTDRIGLVLGDGAELRPRDVFERTAGAIYVVKVADRLGSAVAVSETDLLTNCHVVRSAPTVSLVREGRTQSAALYSANPAADRCVLRTEQNLPKWVKVRPYADVKVGERAFSVGAPRGLELTLAEGLVSSKRMSNGSRLIQTSAPISPGSSGGGLFDAQGNLMGITTFLLKDAQNLNFAIAAEEYAK